MAEESPPPPGDNDAQPWQGSPKKPKAAGGEQSAGVKWKVGALPNASPAFGQSSFLGGKARLGRRHGRSLSTTVLPRRRSPAGVKDMLPWRECHTERRLYAPARGAPRVPHTANGATFWPLYA